ncbi:sialidase family protein [Denitratisoma sp. DHT3]|uniref:sialidase family protein n=1 Tax=Denitratisoma sp. DHT3 TaxID=1981880 RepID=UPI0016466D9D|nr:sialidase family protein [Denitratisoma sp. DHT3]
MKLPAVLLRQRGLSRYLPLGLFLLGLALALPRWLTPPAPARFLPPPQTARLPAIPLLPAESRLLPNPRASAHSVSLAPLGDERIAAAWFAGSREGAADVSILFSIFDGHGWSEPRVAVERAAAQRASERRLRKLGNPVLWRDAGGTLHLWFVSVGYGGWAGSAINHVRSEDGGRHWSPPQRLITSPFWNLSTLVRGVPLPLADGGAALPVYHEFIAKHAEWLRLNAQGRIVDKLRLPGSNRLLQPTAAALDERQALVLLRDTGPAHRIHASRTADGGNHWQTSRATELPNPNAGIALLRLDDGRLLLAYNPQTSDRDRLALALSGDDGNTWSPPTLVEQGEAGAEFSYPALAQDDSSMIHLAYTWKRERIKHLRFSPQGLNGLHGLRELR